MRGILREDNKMLAILCISLLSMGKFTGEAKSEKEEIRILPVQPTPESNTIVMAVAVPKDGDVKRNNPVWVQFRLDGYTLGANSQFDRANEIANSKNGQTVHVIVDDRPAFAIDEPALDPFIEDGWYYDRTFKFELPFRLKEGAHTIRMFPVRSFGESLKGENTFRTVSFYVGEKEGDAASLLQGPYLTYNEPSGRMPLTEEKPVLLDFYVTNTELTPDGYKVLLTLDGKTKRKLDSWQPYYIYGLKSGRHTVRIQLIDRNGKQVSGPYTDIERTIYIRG